MRPPAPLLQPERDLFTRVLEGVLHVAFRLLRYLLVRAGKTVSRDDLARHVWDDDESRGSNVIDVYISYLRKRLGAAGSLIRTIRGVGYTIAGEGRAR